jgi:hypothetical protein
MFGHRSAVPPKCEKCDSSEHVVRFYTGGEKMWVCAEHFKITSTKMKEVTWKDRLLHKMPEPDLIDFKELFPNRAARRTRA